MGNFLIGVKIAILAKINKYRRIDEKWFRMINNSYLKCNCLDNIMLFLTYLGEFSVPAIMMYVFALSGDRAWFIYSMECIAVVSLLIIFLKIFIGRKSPAESLAHIYLMGYNSNQSKSCPSMCAGLSFTIVILVIIYFKSYFSLLVLATSIAISRVYTGICYPLDVILGAIIGIMIPIIMLFLP